MTPPIDLSVVVVVHDMARELPRTLHTLAPGYQRGIGREQFEVVVVDNGSAEPVDPSWIASLPGNVRLLRVDDAPASPAFAANRGVAEAVGGLVGLIVDGARMASPGLLAAAEQAARVADRPVVASLGWHLGSSRQSAADDPIQRQLVEDELLATVAWEHDGYRLFEISTLANSSARGWFAPMGESSALFLPSATWQRLGGLDEKFELPGGGLVNHDLYRRACGEPGAELVVLLGEGTFHQCHGGAATSGRVSWEHMQNDYEGLRGAPYRPPPNEPLLCGRVGPQARTHVGRSVALADERAARGAERRANRANRDAAQRTAPSIGGAPVDGGNGPISGDA